MKKTIAAALAALMLTGMSAAAVTPASAATLSYSIHPTFKVTMSRHHHKHWHQHL